jgi:hypothetical protein
VAAESVSRPSEGNRPSKECLMAKIDLSITAAYLPDWGLAEGVRELVQNARDAEIQFGARMAVRHDKGSRLIIENEGVELPHEALLFGTTTKLERDDLIGRFGEGLKLGILALVRSGFPVRIRSGSEVWVPEIVRSEKFKARILSVEIRGGNEPRKRVRVEVAGISEAGWESLRSNFLFLQKLRASDQVETPAGTLLLHDDFAGQIYVKGIRVARRENVRYGYDLVHAKVDRDRRMLDEHDVKNETSRIWQDAIARRPDLEGPLYQLLKQESAVDAAHASWHLSEAQRKALADRFVNEFGSAAVPVESSGESMQIEHLGRKGIVAARPIREALRTVFGTVDSLKRELAKEIVRRWSWADLATTEQRCFTNAVRMLKSATDVRVEAIDIVDFRSETLRGLYDGEARKIRIARRLLNDEAATLAELVHEAAHSVSAASDGTKDHVQAIELIWTEIYREMSGRLGEAN